MKCFRNSLLIADGEDGLQAARHVIAACTSEREADLIVMGTLRRISIPGLTIGNTAEDVLRDMQTAILVVIPSNFASRVSK